MEKKYILIEHGQGAEEPATVTICGSIPELELATTVAIYGNGDEPCPELKVLHREGIVRFEGDPPIEWLIAGKITDRTFKPTVSFHRQ